LFINIIKIIVELLLS